MHPSLYETARILVLGDSGVGKSSLVHILCHDEPLRTGAPTVGCHIDIRLHSSSASVTRAAMPSLSTLHQSRNGSVYTPSSQSSFIEFYDISGSPSIQDSRSRDMFYGRSYQGIILVHDVCNKRSYGNLWRWLKDYLDVRQSTEVASQPSWHSALGFDTPLLVVGTKTDLASEYDLQRSRHSGSDSIEDQYGGEAISVCTMAPTEFVPNASASIGFNMFFDRVIDPRTPRTASSRASALQQQHHQHHRPSFYSRSNTPQPSALAPDHSATPDNSSPSIPIMDFATFAGQSAPGSDSESERTRAFTPPLMDKPPSRSTTPTPGTSTFTRSGARALYERNRSVLAQHQTSGVPIYSHSSTKTSR